MKKYTRLKRHTKTKTKKKKEKTENKSEPTKAYATPGNTRFIDTTFPIHRTHLTHQLHGLNCGCQAKLICPPSHSVRHQTTQCIMVKHLRTS